MSKIAITLFIDQDITGDEAGTALVNRYLDQLSQTQGELTWEEVTWAFTS